MTEFDFDADEADVFGAPVVSPAPAVAAAKVKGTIRKGEEEARMLEEPIRLLSLDVVGFKRIQAVHVELNKSGLTVIGGKNSQGKSSTLDAVKILCGGKKNTPAKPVHDDDKQATIMGQFEDNKGRGYRIERVVQSNRDDTVRIVRQDGSIVDRPQEFLDSLVGKVWCKPLEFMNSKEDVQAEIIRQWVGLDLSDLTAQEKALYDERELIGREVKRLKGHAESLPYFESASDEEKSATDLVAQFNIATKLQAAHAHTKKLSAEPSALQAVFAADSERIAAEVASIDKQIAELQLRKKAKANERVEIEADYNTNKAASEEKLKAHLVKVDAFIAEHGNLDPDEIAKRMNAVEDENRKARANKDRKKAFEAYSEKDAEYKEYNEQVEAVRATKRRRIAGVVMPVDGLAFDEEGLNLNFQGYPLKQASSSEQMRIAVTIAMRLSGGLKIVLVDGGEALDSDQLALLNSIVVGLDGQVLLTRVCEADSKDADLIIEDGVVLTKKESK